MSKSTSNSKTIHSRPGKSTFFRDMERQKKGIIHKLAKAELISISIAAIEFMRQKRFVRIPLSLPHSAVLEFNF